MKQILKDFIYFTNMENIENLNHNIQEKFSLEKTEIEDQNIEKVQFDNLKFGIYFSKNKEKNYFSILRFLLKLMNEHEFHHHLFL